MWLSSQSRKTQRSDQGAETGVVTLEGEENAVYLTGVLLNLPVLSPGGYCWRPAEGETVLVLKSGADGEESAKGMVTVITHAARIFMPLAELVDVEQELARIAKAATFAASLGLKVNAGHGLTYHNVKAIAAIPEMHELNIGHAIIGRAVMTGLKDAVAEMKRLMLEARG